MAIHNTKSSARPSRFSGKALPLAERFWPRVERSDASDCWPWLGQTKKARHGKRYGIVAGEGPRWKTITAHRAAYELTRGAIPAGMCVCHRCDNPICVNPAHLFLGTHDDNMADMKAKGRHASTRGELNGRAKITADDVLAIYVDHRSTREIANQYGVHISNIRLIRRGLAWRHITLGRSP